MQTRFCPIAQPSIFDACPLVSKDGDKLYRWRSVSIQLLTWLPCHLLTCFLSSTAQPFPTFSGCPDTPHSSVYYTLVTLLHRPFVETGHQQLSDQAIVEISWARCEEAARGATSLLSRYRQTFTLARAPYLIVSDGTVILKLYSYHTMCLVIHYLRSCYYTCSYSSTTRITIRSRSTFRCLFRRTRGERSH